MAQDLTVKSTSLSDDGESLRLAILIHNPANRTRFVYSSVRALRYDPGTKVLEVQLSDEGLVELRDLRGVPTTSSATFILPDMTEVEPKADTEITLRLDRTIHRIDPARSTEVLRFQTLPIHEATAVRVHVAWGDTPFYADPRAPHAMRDQLVRWSKGVARHHMPLGPPPKDKEGDARRRK